MKHLWSPWRMAYLQRQSALCLAVSGKAEGCVLCQKLAEDADDANLIAFRSDHGFIVLNLYPYNNGHVMVVPNRHVPSLEALRPEELLEVMTLVNLALAALRNSMSPGGFNIGVNLGKAAGAGIDGHVHVHVVPRWQGDTNFMPVLAEARVIPESLPDTRRRLAEAIRAILADPSTEEKERDE